MHSVKSVVIAYLHRRSIKKPYKSDEWDCSYLVVLLLSRQGELEQDIQLVGKSIVLNKY